MTPEQEQSRPAEIVYFDEFVTLTREAFAKIIQADLARNLILHYPPPIPQLGPDGKPLGEE